MTKNKLKLWNPETPWEVSERSWDEASALAQKSHPIKTLSTLPKMPGITEESAKWLQYKSIKYLLFQDPNHIFLRYFFKRPLQYAYHFIRSALQGRPYKRDGDFFLYGIDSVENFQKELKKQNTLLVVGFSYCHKPYECPSGRFTSQCQSSLDHPVCRQCFIGKAVHALPAKNHIHPLFIPTIHYIGEELFKLREKYPDKTLLFLITACEMTLEMFGNWGNMIQAKGIGVRLDGRICNTMKAFELSESGIKPGLTVVLPETQTRILNLIKTLWEPQKKTDDGTV